MEHGQESILEFDLPQGWRWTLSIVEISEGGVGFRLDDGRPALAVGTCIDDVTVDVGGIQVGGSLRVLHVTQYSGADTICGAVFAPATESDERMMALILGAFERRAPRSD